jgi:glucose/arabinose dehydrogenase
VAGASLTLAVPPAGAAVAEPGPGPASGSQAAAAEDFQQVNLAKGEPEVGEPMSLAVLPDRSVLHTSRDGELRITDAAGTTRLAGQLDVYAHDEEGLQGVGVDPQFTTNRFIYLYERLRVRLNGVKINDFTNTDPVRSLRDGHVGIQNHGADDRMSFRDIRIRELPVKCH